MAHGVPASASGGSAGRIDHVQDWLRGALTRPAKQAGAIRTAWPAFGFQIDRELWVLAKTFKRPITQIAQLLTDFLRLEARQIAISEQRFFPVKNTPQYRRAKPVS